MRPYWVLTLPTLAVLVVWSTRAEAQVQNCALDQFVDRTAPGADRQLAWDFDIATKVVPAPRAPAMTLWLEVALTTLLTLIGWLLLWNRRSRWA